MHRPNTVKNKAISLPIGHSRHVGSRSTKQPVVRRKIVSNHISTPQFDSSAAIALKNMGVGKILLIIGNGPSHTEADLPRLVCEGIDIMSINKPDDRIWPTKYWMYCDNSQTTRHRALWSSYNGTIINSSSIRDIRPNTIRIKSSHGYGFSRNLKDGIFIGRSSVYSAIQVGVYMNYDHIYVFGCDMATVNGKLYPWGSNPDVSDGSRVERFATEAKFYNWMGDNLAQEIRNKITFCTRYNPWPFIKKFEKLDHVEAIDIILNRISGQTQTEHA